MIDSCKQLSFSYKLGHMEQLLVTNFIIVVVENMKKENEAICWIRLLKKFY